MRDLQQRLQLLAVNFAAEVVEALRAASNETFDAAVAKTSTTERGARSRKTERVANRNALTSSSLLPWRRGASYDDAKREVIDRFQRSYLLELVENCRGNVSEVSRRSGLSRPQIYEIFRRHSIEIPDYAGRSYRR